MLGDKSAFRIVDLFVFAVEYGVRFLVYEFGQASVPLPADSFVFQILLSQELLELAVCRLLHYWILLLQRYELVFLIK